MSFIPARWWSIVRTLIAPHSKNKDLARREGILNILLISCLGLIFFATGVAFWNEIRGIAEAGATLNTAIIGLIFLGAYFLSRAGKARAVAYVIVTLLFVAATYDIYRWGADLPQALLIYALVVIMSGILINSNFSFLLTVLMGAVLLTATIFQIPLSQSTVPNWRDTPLTLGDSVVASVTLLVMTVVSWLFNREIESALKRARLSESALKRQRDELEIAVEQRTVELKQIQAEKLLQLYRLAEFGKATSGLFHDLANPLTLISWNLNSLAKQIQQPELVQAQEALTRALTGTKRLEHFVQTVKKQIRAQEVMDKFSLNEEITESMQVLAYKSTKNHVHVRFKSSKKILTFGNPVKFSQLVTNLLANAIDAYEGIYNRKKLVEIRLEKNGQEIRFEIQDWGSGIDQKDLAKIFNPLFTTKGLEKGTGIGLSICKEIIEKDLQGTYAVESQKGSGSTFRVEFPFRKGPEKSE